MVSECSLHKREGAEFRSPARTFKGKKLVCDVVSGTVVPPLGRWAQEGPWNSLASNCRESASSRFIEKLISKSISK